MRKVVFSKVWVFSVTIWNTWGLPVEARMVFAYFEHDVHSSLLPRSVVKRNREGRCPLLKLSVIPRRASEVQRNSQYYQETYHAYIHIYAWIVYWTLCDKECFALCLVPICIMLHSFSKRLERSRQDLREFASRTKNPIVLKSYTFFNIYEMYFL